MVQFPLPIGNLAASSELQLYENKLSGPIPTTIENLIKLTTSNLFMNELSASILASIGNLAALPELQLNENKLYGPIPTS